MPLLHALILDKDLNQLQVSVVQILNIHVIITAVTNICINTCYELKCDNVNTTCSESYVADVN